ncbi:NAD(P)/FAD-dependent oxidoreductase [Actinomadura namibiensis]|uniref:Thioredoxin reductase n=1 Tax=Actinomadura namibiensis TaxID=182080 RepID=A0A7W3LQS5_ACTNM|nr:NAD(P)/FAD-dependent oxidoreductase [Actinomadura namibiensis]MBA8952534.1 thioredoxin reductase [Actinomadura namibiensis]
MSRATSEQVMDAVVIGGGAAGLSAAVALSRFRRHVVAVDAGQPRNAPAEGVHNYLSRDGMPPAELLAAGRRELAGYGGQVVEGTVVAARRADEGFAVELADGRALRARRLLVATGVVDGLPDVPGMRERWGRDVLHCPYCHGWEARDRAIVVYGTNPMAAHAAQMWRQLSDDVTLVLEPGTRLRPEQAEELAARGVEVTDGPITELLTEGDRLTGARLADGRVLPCTALAVGTRLEARADFLSGLGLEPVEHRMGDAVMGTRVEADATGATPVPGVFVAGNAADPFGQVIGSAAAGLTAAGALNASLIAEEVERAVAEHRARSEEPFSARIEAEVSERVVGARRHGL